MPKKKSTKAQDAAKAAKASRARALRASAKLPRDVKYNVNRDPEQSPNRPRPSRVKGMSKAKSPGIKETFTVETMSGKKFSDLDAALDFLDGKHAGKMSPEELKTKARKLVKKTSKTKRKS